MSSIRDRRKHQNRVEAKAEALDLNHRTTTSVPQTLVSAGVSSSDNPTNLRSLSDGQSHTQAKDESTNQHLDLYQGATGENLCSQCNEINAIFDFETGIPARSWRTLDLLARVDRPSTGWGSAAPKKVWKVTNEISKTCSFCSFLMACASRMAVHAEVDLKSDEWFLALGVRNLEFVTGIARGEPWNNYFTPVLELKLCQGGDNKNKNPFVLILCQGGDNKNPFGDFEPEWKDTDLILPVKPRDNGNYEVSDTLDWKVIVTWLETCQSYHDDDCCNDLATTSREDIPSFCLIDCEGETIILAAEIHNPDYVTLSYVWGGPLTTPQVTDPSTSLPVLPKSNERPRVVNDAMTVVQTIGYRYLWVDRYCIPQSDHNIKNIQIINMGKIYSMSVLTIIAAAGKDAEYGLSGVGSGPRLEPIWTTIRDGSRVIPVIYFEPPHNDILSSIWNSRGWTYQEALLSKRRLVFTDRHVYFQCESRQSVGYPADYNPGASFESEVFPFRKHYDLVSWVDAIWGVINDYTKRTLSYEEDAIDAMQGILESFRDKCDVWFFYGLPVMGHHDSTLPDVLELAFGTFRQIDSGMQAILNSLLWNDQWDRAVATTSTRETRFSDQAQFRRIGFPSWTWAGWKTANSRSSIDFPCQYRSFTDAYCVPDGFPFDIRISYDDQCLTWSRDNQEIQRRSENISQFPNFLVITGPVFDVTITCADGEDQHSSSNQTGHVVWGYSSPPFLAHYKGPPFSPEEVGGRTIDLVALCLFSQLREDAFDFHTLMLRPVGEDVHGQIYERVTCTSFYRWSLPSTISLADLNLRQMELRIR